MTYRSLSPEKLIATIDQLQKRIAERFPGSGLSNVAAELLSVSHQAATRAQWIARPNIFLRSVTLLLVAVIIGVVMTLVPEIDPSSGMDRFSDAIQAIEACANILILASAGIYFLISTEIRVKRSRSLKMLHELRALAHIVDIHQLTKDPLDPDHSTPSSPVRSMTKFELSRYLDYCSEMLSLIGKLAALYAQYLDDRVVLESVDEIEDLTSGLSGKIWQKIIVLDAGKN